MQILSNYMSIKTNSTNNFKFGIREGGAFALAGIAAGVAITKGVESFNVKPIDNSKSPEMVKAQTTENIRMAQIENTAQSLETNLNQKFSKELKDRSITQILFNKKLGNTIEVQITAKQGGLKPAELQKHLSALGIKDTSIASFKLEPIVNPTAAEREVYNIPGYFKPSVVESVVKSNNTESEQINKLAELRRDSKNIETDGQYELVTFEIAIDTDNKAEKNTSTRAIIENAATKIQPNAGAEAMRDIRKQKAIEDKYIKDGKYIGRF